MIVCVHLPRFELAVAAGDDGRTGGAAKLAIAGRPLALAPEPGRGGGRVGEVSGVAEAFGVACGMQLGEALARCPELVLVPGEPVLAARRWEGALGALESIGAAVEDAGPGMAFFESAGLHGLYGDAEATILSARRALGRPARIGAGPSRFCALAAALSARTRRPLLLEGDSARRWLAAQPVTLLGRRRETASLVEPLQRLGIRTLGELDRLGAERLCDRFGAAGARAYAFACGEDEPLRPRAVRERLEETMEVGDASSAIALARVLGVLVDRLLARPERRGRSLRAVTISAGLVAGGGWREEVVFRQSQSDPERIRLALSLRLALLPAPAASLGLAAERLGPAGGEQGALLDQGRAERAACLREAVAQMRAVAGRDAALRAVLLDIDSRVPERRAVLAPVVE